MEYCEQLFKSPKLLLVAAAIVTFETYYLTQVHFEAKPLEIKYEHTLKRLTHEWKKACSNGAEPVARYKDNVIEVSCVDIGVQKAKERMLLEMDCIHQLNKICEEQEQKAVSFFNAHLSCGNMTCGLSFYTLHNKFFDDAFAAGEP